VLRLLEYIPNGVSDSELACVTMEIRQFPLFPARCCCRHTKPSVNGNIRSVCYKDDTPV